MKYFLDCIDGLKIIFKVVFIPLFVVSLLCTPFSLMDTLYPSYGYLPCNSHIYHYQSYPIYIDQKLDSTMTLGTLNDEVFGGLPFLMYNWTSTTIQKSVPELAKEHQEKQRIWENHRSRMKSILGY